MSLRRRVQFKAVKEMQQGKSDFTDKLTVEKVRIIETPVKS